MYAIRSYYGPLAGSKQLRNDEPLTSGTTYYVASAPVTYNGVTYTEDDLGASFVAGAATNFTGIGTVTTTAPKNGFMPMYTFNTA